MKNVITLFVIFAITISSNLLFAQNDWEVYTTSNSGLCSDSVFSIYTDNNNNLWFGTAEGVSKFDGSVWTSYTSKNSPLQSGAFIYKILQHNNNCYFGGLQGLVTFDGTNWDIISGAQVSSMDFDNAGNLWFGTFGAGLYKYDGANLTNYTSFNSPLPSENIRDIKKDKNGNIWIAMTGGYSSSPAGIGKFDGSSWEFFNSKNSILSNENIYSIAEDKNGNLWFGADSLLLFKFDGTNWVRYDLSNQITSNWISCLDVDSDGNIWAGLGPNYGAQGIIKFDGANITRYDQSTGFPINDDIHDLKIDNSDNVLAGTWHGLIKLYNGPKINVETLTSSDSLKSLTGVNLQWGYQFQNNINIEYSTDNGSNWMLAAGNAVVQNNLFSWEVPVVAPASNQCKIRISDVNNPNNKIESNSFTIYAKVEAPVFTPDGGIKNNTISVSISCKTADADIYYTTDGSEPNQSSKRYSSSIYINKSTELKVKAFKSDWVESDLNEANYQMKVAEVSFSPDPGTYTNPFYVALNTVTDSAIIHYTLDGSQPNQSSTVYYDSLDIYINNNTTVRAIAYRQNFDSSIVAIGAYHFSGSNINAVIKTDSVWIDSDFNGYEERIVDGSESSITNDSFKYLIWTVNGDSAGNGAKVNLKLKTGTNKIVLIAKGYKGENGWDTAVVNVYSSKLKTNGGIYSAPSQIDNDNFIVTSADDEVYQFDSTGTVNWNILTGGDIQSTTCINDENNIYVGSTDTRLYSFKRDGAPNWDKAMGGIITSSPSTGKDGVVYVGISTGRLYALDKTGTVMWNVQTGGAIVSSPSVSLNGDVYAGSCDKKLYSINKDGNINWTFTTGDSIFSSPAIGNDSSIIFGSNDGYMYKLNPNGIKIWSYYAGGKIKSSPIIIDDGRMVFGNTNGEIICINSDGSVFWKYNDDVPVIGTAAISQDGQILIGDNSGKLNSFNKQGDLLWYLQTNASIQSPVLIVDNNLAVFGNLDGEVFTLKLNSSGLNKMTANKYEWPTFKGNNKRTGNKSEVLTGINNENSSEVKDYRLAQNYPNPFNPSTIINYEIPKSGLVTIKMYDVLGREVSTLVNEVKIQGRYSVKFDGSNLASGLYFYRITSNNFTETRKMMLMK
ncbi:MAG: PQQ-binding-like beta-propeller repeat protein [Ignavibacteriaceae bacterium]